MFARLLLVICCMLFTRFAEAADYFWVGNSGNWSDISHWATTSGGSVTHSQAPTSEDNVIFDANSFTTPGQVVTIQLDIAFCRNFDWSSVTNNPTLRAGATTAINVFGSVLAGGGMSLDVDGSFRLSGTAMDNTVDFGGERTGNSIFFAGTGGWALNSAITVDSAFVLNEGTLTTGGNPISCGYFESDTRSSRTLDLGTSTVTISGETLDPDGYGQAFFYIAPLRLRAQGLTVNNSTGSTFELTSPNNDVFILGPGTLNLGTLRLSSPTGSSRIAAYGEFVRNYDNPFRDANGAVVNFSALDLNHSTTLFYGIGMGDLSVAPGRIYTFRGEDDFPLTSLTAIGDCLAGTVLRSTEANSTARFIPSAPLTAEFISLSGIEIAGGISALANQSIDLGNNPGWTIDDKVNTPFFWIGGTGNWNDPMHWSLSSGGPASGCVPTFNDDVFFDGQSFNGAGQTVTINTENVYCRNMDWTGVTNTPTLAGVGETNLRISGSLTFSPTMEQQYMGTVYFQSERLNNLITTNRQRFNQSVTFTGIGGWGLRDSFYVFDRLSFESGNLTTNNAPVSCREFRSEGEGMRALDLGTSTLRIEDAGRERCEANWRLRSTNLTLSAGNSTIELSARCNTFMSTEGNTMVTYNNIHYQLGYAGYYSNTQDVNFDNVETLADSVRLDVSGNISGLNRINVLTLGAGNEYEFATYEDTRIGTLLASGNCASGHTSLTTNAPGIAARVDVAEDGNYDNLLVRGIDNQGGGLLIATNSIDAGNNSGWDITGEGSRTLYWVGDSGDWFDMAHWSLSSGGPGGACIPTAIDDVFFDQNSFSGAGQNIFSTNTRRPTCRDLTFTADVPTINYQTDYTRLFGSLSIGATINYFTGQTSFSGEGEHTVLTSGVNIRSTYFNGSGTYRLLDDLTAFSIFHGQGTINTDGFSVTSSIYEAFNDSPKRLLLGSSYVHLTSEDITFRPSFVIGFNTDIEIDPGTSLLELSAPNQSIDSQVPFQLNSVLFSSVTGTGEITLNQEALATFSKLTFNGSGNVDGTIATDSLIFSAGKSYTLKADETQRINRYWQTIGNNCTPISLMSSQLGQQATVSMPAEARLLSDFVQMTNITATGGNQFLAGARSTDVNNSNQGWIFDSAPEFIDVGFLGTDRAICNGEPITLNAYNFTPGETYRWQDGSTDSVFVADRSGTYGVEVTFQTSCVIRDSITVLAENDFIIDLPDDPEICSGQTITFDADVGAGTAIYTWQDGSTGSTFEASNPGQYRVSVELGGCVKQDSTELAVLETPSVDLGPDISRCTGEEFTLSSPAATGDLLWQDGTSAPTFAGDQPGIYWLEAANGSCADRDSVEVVYISAEAVDLGPDTTLCAEGPFLLSAGVAGASYSWQDNSSQETFTVTASGTYSVTAEVSGCSATDTIVVTYAANPPPDLAPAYAPCIGETFLVTTTIPADAYAWSDGTTGDTFTSDVAGNYRLTAFVGSCTVEQSFTLSFTPLPVIDLGPDLRVCPNENNVLTLPRVATWQAGTVSDTYPVTASGRYRATVTDAGCSASDSVEVEVLTLPSIALGEDQAACAGEVLTVDVVADPGVLTWEDGSDATRRDFTQTTTLFAELEDTEGCAGRDTVTLTFTELPTLELGQDTLVCDNAPFEIVPRQNGGTLTWPDGSNGETFSVATPGETIATLDDNGCATTDSITVNFRECIFFEAYLPNVFSPNMDGTNDEFFPQFNPNLEILSYRMQIYDRWGALYFVSEDVQIGWDGTRAGEAVDTGVFMYAIEITYRDDMGEGSEVLSGDVLVMPQ